MTDLNITDLAQKVVDAYQQIDAWSKPRTRSNKEAPPTVVILACVVLDLTARVERMEELAESLDATALWAINHPDMDDDVKAHARADRGLAARIRAILNRENR